MNYKDHFKWKRLFVTKLNLSVEFGNDNYILLNIFVIKNLIRLLLSLQSLDDILFKEKLFLERM